MTKVTILPVWFHSLALSFTEMANSSKLCHCNSHPSAQYAACTYVPSVFFSSIYLFCPSVMAIGNKHHICYVNNCWSFIKRLSESKIGNKVCCGDYVWAWTLLSTIFWLLSCLLETEISSNGSLRLLCLSELSKINEHFTRLLLRI